MYVCEGESSAVKATRKERHKQETDKSSGEMIRMRGIKSVEKSIR